MEAFLKVVIEGARLILSLMLVAALAAAIAAFFTPIYRYAYWFFFGGARPNIRFPEEGPISRLLNRNRRAPANPSQRIESLLDHLSVAANEMDETMKEIIGDMKGREAAMEQLQERNKGLQDEETNLRKRIEKLKDVPIEVADYFRQINESIMLRFEKRKVKRDVLMLLLGVVLTLAVTKFSEIVDLGAIVRTFTAR